MAGIVSYGGYIPRLRLQRMGIFQSMGWFAPAIMMVAQGERSMCNWDEDSLTMAVAAARDCLVGMDKGKLDALYACSTTLPFADRQNAGVVAAALNLNKNALSQGSFTVEARGTGEAAELDADRMAAVLEQWGCNSRTSWKSWAIASIIERYATGHTYATVGATESKRTWVEVDDDGNTREMSEQIVAAL